MAITKYQSPDLLTMNRKVHQVANPEWYTCTSTNSSSYSDFKYKFSIVDSTGTIASFKQSPNISGYGAFSPTSIVGAQLISKFNPTITTWTDVGENGVIKQYRVDVSEFYSGAEQVSTLQSYYKVMALNAQLEDFTYSNYLLNSSTKKFLSPITSATTLNMRITDYATVRFLNGSFSYLSSLTYKSYPYVIRLDLTKANGDHYHYYSKTYNPWWSATNPLNSSSSTFDSAKGRCLDFPVGPANIVQMYWMLDYSSISGSISPAVQYLGSSIIEEGDSYEVYAWTWPYGDMSIRYKYYITCENENKPGVMICWENEVGGISYYLATKRYTQQINAERYSYRKSKDEFGQASQTTNTTYVGHNQYSREDTVYGGQATNSLIVNTDWLDEYELAYLKDIQTSKNIYVYYNSRYYHALLVNDAQVVATTKSGLIQLQLEFEHSNKIKF